MDDTMDSENSTRASFRSAAITDSTVTHVTNTIRAERDERRVIRIAEDFALRLAMDGYIKECNTIIAEITRFRPDELNFLIKRSLEMMWYTVGPRPQTTFPAPTEAELIEMQEEQRYYDLHDRDSDVISNLHDVPLDSLELDRVASLAKKFVSVRHLSERKLISRSEWGSSWDEGPITMPTDEEEKQGLECFKNYMARREEDKKSLDQRLLATFVNVAFKHGMDLEGAEWLDVALHNLLETDDSFISRSGLACARFTSRHLGHGAMQKITGTEQKMATRAAEDVSQAVKAWFEEETYRPFAHLGWPELLARLETTVAQSHSDGEDDYETYLRPPATEQAIEAAEDRLGLALPEDYKVFLRMSNGTRYPSSTLMEPALASLESIDWDEEIPKAAMLKVELLPRLFGTEWQALPELHRALKISDAEDYDQYVYLIEPALVKLGKESLLRHRREQKSGEDDAGKSMAAPDDEQTFDSVGRQEDKWMVSTWAGWRADHMPYDSFRDYLEWLLSKMQTK